MARTLTVAVAVVSLAGAAACSSEADTGGGEPQSGDGGTAEVDPYPDVEGVEGCENLVKWTGDLLFLGAADAEMTDFCGSGYNAVEGTLSLFDVDTVAPLTCVCEVGGSFGVNSDAALDLSAFGSLRSVGGSLVLDVDGVTDIDGFGDLQVVGRELVVWGAELEDISGFGALYAIGDGLTLPAERHAPSLANVSGLNALATVSFVEVGGTALHHLSGLQSLQMLTWEYADLDIQDNPYLRDVHGLTGPLVVPDSVDIVNNPLLESVDGLHGIATIGGCLHIEDNPSLPFADALALRDAIGSLNIGCVQIEGNGEK